MNILTKFNGRDVLILDVDLDRDIIDCYVAEASYVSGPNLEFEEPLNKDELTELTDQEYDLIDNLHQEYLYSPEYVSDLDYGD